MIGLMIFFQIRKRPPMSSAMALTSPIDPPITPRNIIMLLGSSPPPSARMPSGVAPVAASACRGFGTGQVVISVAKEMNRTILAVIAGFTIFLPMPPNSCFTTMMATKQPTMAIQYGRPDGTLNAISIPVRAAERSPTVCVFFISLLYTHSKNMLAAMQTTVRMSALNPNTQMLTSRDGTRARITMAMVLEVSRLVTICGADDTTKLL